MVGEDYGMKKVFGVIGDPIEHSFSPALHTIAFQEQGLDFDYVRVQVRPYELPQALQKLSSELSGFNVTIPHKQSIIQYLDDLDSSAERYGAVNTVKNEGGTLIGYNTDGFGFMEGLREITAPHTIKTTLLLGAGGAANVVALELAPYSSLTIANRSLERAERLAERVKKHDPKSVVQIVNLESIPQENYDLVVNATPIGMGMYQNQVPVERSILWNAGIVYDLIYNPQETQLLKAASKAGCQTLNGLPMLIYQGLKSEEIWLEQTFSDQLKQTIIRRVRKELTRLG